jgi:uncharacterized membrane protein
MPIVFGVIGAVVGVLFGEAGTAILGFAVGFLWGRLAELRRGQAALRTENRGLRERFEVLERSVDEARVPADAGPAPAETARPAPPPIPRPTPKPAPARPAAAAVVQPPPPTPPTAGPTAVTPPLPGVPPPMAASTPAPAASPPSGPPPAIRSGAFWPFEFFTTGNVVAKIGMVVVFFGVAFLVRYTAERGLFPIEYRLTSVAVGALVLLGAGWRLRRSRRDYALVLQGGAVGVLYLTVFAAFRLYGLLPAPPTFALLLTIVAMSAALAVLQNTMSLAVLGTSGGFLAPILASTGSGSHVALFSYYAVLNAGVFGIAWFRAWRFLNWVAFVFTFGIGFVWGAQFYQPRLFTTTEPFLIFFFLLFVAVAILFAGREPSGDEPGTSDSPALRGYIDSSLVFGTPALAFGMQAVLVRDIPFGRAYSAVVLSALYLALTRALWRRDGALRPLAEAFLALGVVFLTLAVPLAFAGHATAASWALEGAGLVWVGIRQQRLLARLAGAALLVGAGVAFGVMSASEDSGLPVLNMRALGGVAIAVGSLVAGRLLAKAGESLREAERLLVWALLVWGLMWWFGTALSEVGRHVQEPYVGSAVLLAVTSGALLVGLLARFWQWREMMLALTPVGPLTWWMVLPALMDHASRGPLVDLGWAAWPTLVAGSLLLAFWFASTWPAAIVGLWHTGIAWLFIFLATWTIAVDVRQLVPEARTWSSTAWCLVPSAFVLALGRATWPVWPIQRFHRLYSTDIPLLPVLGILAWVVWAYGQPGTPAPLPYVPLVNPLELTQALGLLTAYAWWMRLDANRAGDRAIRAAGRPLVAALAFVALNALVARVVHFYFDVPYDLERMARSSVFQTGISMLWGIAAGSLMTLARLWLDRTVWLSGAALIGALLVKLFMVDLSNVGGIPRIVSFLASGVLILAIGYVAPAPPKAAKTI